MQPGNSLAVQWLGLGAFTEVARVQCLVGELRSHKPHGVAKKKPKRIIQPATRIGPAMSLVLQVLSGGDGRLGC